MSIESTGGRESRKNKSAPHTNITIDRMNGTIVHDSSRISEPWMSAPTSSG